MAIIKTVEGKTPQWGKNCFIAENAVLTPATVFLAMTVASGIVRYCALTWMPSDVETG